jgi:tripartite-type tricarboxylate transporter receptor subunit TctC
MKKTMRFSFLLLFAFLFHFSFAFGQNTPKADDQYPSRPIQVIVPYGAGGGTDINARLVAEFWKKSLGQPIAIVNRPGAAGALGYREIAHAEKDGYNLGFLSYPDSPILVASKGQSIGFLNEDFIPIGTFTRSPLVLAVQKGGPIKTIDEFVEYAKKNPKKISVSIVGDAHKLAAVMIEQAMSIELNPVIFKSGAEAMNTLMGGHTLATLCASQFAIGAADKGILPIAITGRSQIDAFPGVKTFHEMGYDVPIEMMRIVCAPKGLPAPIVQKLASTISELKNDKEFIEKIKASGEVYGAVLPPELDQYYRETNAKIGKIVEKYKSIFVDK